MAWTGGLSGLLATGYLGLLTLLWTLLFLGVRRWGEGWVLRRRAAGEVPPERVSICIPARDEARNIGACLDAALASDWPDLEVVVVDDRSTDDTRRIAEARAARDARLRVLAGEEPPPGWAGKPWACLRAAGEASGSVLVFIDADVRLAPAAVPSLVGELRDANLGLLSAFGTWELVSFWERALVPTVGWLIRGAVDLDRVNQPGRPEAFANGQLMVVDAEVYRAVDGHAVVRDEVLDDVRFAERLKRRGVPIGLRVAPWAFRVRLYRSLGEIVAGYAKNLYEGMGRRPVVGLGAVLFIAVGTLLPHVLLWGGLAARLLAGWTVPGAPWLAWLAALCALQIAFRWRLDRRDGRSGWDAWTHPVANVLLAWIILRSVLGIESRWKGRRFRDGRAVAD